MKSSKLFLPYESDLTGCVSGRRGFHAVEGGVYPVNGQRGQIKALKRKSIGGVPVRFDVRELNAWSDYFTVHSPDVWITLTHDKATGKRRSYQYLKDYLNACARDKRIKTHLTAFVCGDWQRNRISVFNEKSWHHHVGLYVHKRGRTINQIDMYKCLVDRWSDKNVSLGRSLVQPYIVEKKGMIYALKKHQSFTIHTGCYGPARCRKAGGCKHS